MRRAKTKTIKSKDDSLCLPVSTRFDPDVLYSSKEISQFLNNAMIASMSPPSGAIKEARKKRLRHYTLAILAPLIEHTAIKIEDNNGSEYKLISPEELVAVLVGAAQYIHQALVLKKFEIVKLDSVPELE